MQDGDFLSRTVAVSKFSCLQLRISSFLLVSVFVVVRRTLTDWSMACPAGGFCRCRFPTFSEKEVSKGRLGANSSNQDVGLFLINGIVSEMFEACRRTALSRAHAHLRLPSIPPTESTV